MSKYMDFMASLALVGVLMLVSMAVAATSLVRIATGGFGATTEVMAMAAIVGVTLDLLKGLSLH